MNGEQIKLKYKQLEASKVAMAKLLNFSLPVEAAYWIGRNVKSIAQATKPLEEERKQLILKFGIKDEKTNTFSINPNIEEFKKFIEQEIDVIIHPIELSLLFPARLTVNEIEQIDFMIKTESVKPLIKVVKSHNEIK